MTHTTAQPLRIRRSLPELARRRPVTAMLAALLVPTLLTYVVIILTRLPFGIGRVAELVYLVAAPLVVTGWISGRPGIKRLYSGLLRWRIGVAWYVVIVPAVPAVSLVLADATGTLDAPAGGWAHLGVIYLLFLVGGALTANIWEETAWGGFVQGRLMARYGLLAGSLLTAIPFSVIHLPLAFESAGLHTRRADVLLTWGVLIVLAPFMRYLIGIVLVDTGGSTLAAGLLHASMNATLAQVIFRGGWQMPAALVVLSLVFAAYRVGRPVIWPVSDQPSQKWSPDGQPAARAGGLSAAGGAAVPVDRGASSADRL